MLTVGRFAPNFLKFLLSMKSVYTHVSPPKLFMYTLSTDVKKQIKQVYSFLRFVYIPLLLI